MDKFENLDDLEKDLNLKKEISEEELREEELRDKELKNWNQNQKNQKHIPEEKLKKWIGYALFGVIIALTIYAFIKASLPEPTNVKRETQQEQEEDKSSSTKNKNMDMGLDFDNISYKEYTKNQKIKNNVNETGEEAITPYIKNQKNMNNSSDNIPNVSNVRNAEDEILKELRANQIKDELLARRSNLKFDNNTESKNSEKSQQYIESRGDEARPIAYPEDQNYQAQKKAFLKSEDAKDNYNKYSEQEVFSPYEVKAGSIIPGILLTGLNSDLPGTILGTVREDVYDSVSGNYLLIPKGTKIKGTYDSGISFGQTRILVVWQRLIFPNGKSLNLDKFSGVDMSGFAGMTGKVNNHTYELFKAVVLSSVLGAGTAVISDKKDRDEDDDWKSSAGAGAGEQIMAIGANISNRILGVQPTIEIAQGARFNIIVESDLILSPYKRR